jgi:hypothetical protein
MPMSSINKHLKESRREIIIALENLDFVWDSRQVNEFIKQWESGISIQNIAKYFERTQEECACLIMHLSLQDDIKNRKGGVFGDEERRSNTA